MNKVKRFFNNFFVKIGVCILCCSTVVHAITLEHAVFDTLQNNPDMAEAIQQYHASKSDVDIAKGRFLPSLDLMGDVGKEDISRDRIPDTNKDRSSAKLRLLLPLFKGFSNVNEYDRASFKKMSNYYHSLSKAEEITLTLTKGYIDVLSSKDIIVLSEENLKHHKKTYDLIHKRADQGVTNKADLSQIKGRLARASANIVAAKSNYNDAVIQYIQIANVAPENLEKPQVDSDYLPKSNQKANDIAFSNHQALFSSQFDMKAATSASKAQQSHYYPEFDVVGEREWKNDVVGFRGHEDEWRVLLEMKWNLFSGGQHSAAHQKTVFQEESSRMNLNSVRRSVKANVNASWNAYEQLEKERVFLREYVEESETTERLYGQQFNAGRRSLVDLLDSQNELFQSRKAYIASDYDYLYAQYRVIASMSYILDALHVDVARNLK
ncbi:MAG: TolC family outer membrane protein [Endozoicomonadaceae bacterium]|nr:TolC family outer membrane protein [Endozoicomonadaceae bacterium]